MGRHSDANIYVLGRDNTNWSIDKDREAVIQHVKHAGLNVTQSVFSATHIVCVWYDAYFSPRYAWLRLLRLFKKTQVIAVITNDVSLYEEKIPLLKKHFAHCIVASQRSYDFLQKHGIESTIIPYYTNPEIFYPLNDSREELCTELDIPVDAVKGKTIIASLQRDSLGSDCLKPKWQKHPELLVRIMEQLPADKYVLLLAGPRRHFVARECSKRNIPYVFVGDASYHATGKDDMMVNNLDLQTMNKLYNLADAYVVTSRNEGGPKAVHEAALTRTPIYSTNVGLAPDVLHEEVFYTEDTVDELVQKIENNTAQQYVDEHFAKAQDDMNNERIANLYRDIIESTPN